MNKQEAIYRMFASRAAVLENESTKCGTGRWEFAQTGFGRYLKATEPNGKTHIVLATDIGSVALANLLQSMICDLS